MSEEEEAFYRKHGLLHKPTYCGQEADRGRIVAGQEYDGEGYAILKCGNTEVKLGYTTLHDLHIAIPPGDSACWGTAVEVERALNSIKVEAMLGRTGD